LLCHDNPGKPAFLRAGLVAPGELKDAIIYFERNAWLLKKALVQLSGPLAAPMLVEDFPRRPMRSLVIIKCDGAR
jgi:hypothetical protein